MKDFVVLCKEINRETGKKSVYEIQVDVTERLLKCLGIRSRLNPELSYFVVQKEKYSQQKEMFQKLIRTSPKKELEHYGIIQL